jgi:hypothetical protein
LIKVGVLLSNYNEPVPEDHLGIINIEALETEYEAMGTREEDMPHFELQSPVYRL